jgi:hypothetical protein
MPEICLGKFYESASVEAEYLMHAKDETLYPASMVSW